MFLPSVPKLRSPGSVAAAVGAAVARTATVALVLAQSVVAGGGCRGRCGGRLAVIVGRIGRGAAVVAGSLRPFGGRRRRRTGRLVTGHGRLAAVAAGRRRGRLAVV